MGTGHQEARTDDVKRLGADVGTALNASKSLPLPPIPAFSEKESAVCRVGRGITHPLARYLICSVNRDVNDPAFVTVYSYYLLLLIMPQHSTFSQRHQRPAQLLDGSLPRLLLQSLLP